MNDRYFEMLVRRNTSKYRKKLSDRQWNYIKRDTARHLEKIIPGIFEAFPIIRKTVMALGINERKVLEGANFMYSISKLLLMNNQVGAAQFLFKFHKNKLKKSGHKNSPEEAS